MSRTPVEGACLRAGTVTDMPEGRDSRFPTLRSSGRVAVWLTSRRHTRGSDYFFGFTATLAGLVSTSSPLIVVPNEYVTVGYGLLTWMPARLLVSYFTLK